MKQIITLLLLIVSVTINAQEAKTTIPTGIEHAHNVQDTTHLWVLQLIDSIRYETDLCQTTMSKPSVKRYLHESGDYLFRLRYTYGHDHSYIHIYNADGTERAKCIVTPMGKDCDDFKEYSNFTFTKELLNVWSCKDGFNCEAKLRLGLFQKFEATASGDQCVDQTRTIGTKGVFSAYQWSLKEQNIAKTYEVTVHTSGDYNLKVTDADQCVDHTSVQVHVYTPKKVETEGNKILCPGETSIIKSNDWEHYEWSTGETSQEIEVSEGGDYQLIVANEHGCEDTTTFSIMSLADRHIKIEIGKDEFYRDEVVPLQLRLYNMDEQHVQDITWGTSGDLTCDDCIRTFGKFASDSDLFAMVTDEYDCIYEADVMIRPDSVYKDIYGANVFSPDGDGKNDLFVLRSKSGAAIIHQIKIFNRWGVPIFQQGRHHINDEDMGWDGRHNGEYAPPGVYVYVAEVEYIDGSHKHITGDLLLVR